MRKKSLTTKKGEVRELTSKDIRSMRRAKDVLPSHLVDILPKRNRGQRGPQKLPKKISVTLRYSPEVVKYFKTSGAGWQTRLDEALKDWIRHHPRRSATSLK